MKSNKETKVKLNIGDCRKKNLSEKLPGIDVDAALEMFDEDYDFYLNILEKFWINNCNIKNEILVALEQKDSIILKRKIHTLKGSSGNLGANHLMNLANASEEDIDNDIIDSLKIRQVLVELDNFLNSIKELLGLNNSQDIVNYSEHSQKIINDKKPTILIVDDSPLNIQILGKSLKEDYDLKVATNGEEALRIAHSEKKPDLIILDIIMPEMDGYEVCKQLKASTVTREIPVIFITAMSEKRDEAYGLNLGAIDYITKPFTSSIVKSRVKDQLEFKKL